MIIIIVMIISIVIIIIILISFVFSLSEFSHKEVFIDSLLLAPPKPPTLHNHRHLHLHRHMASKCSIITNWLMSLSWLNFIKEIKKWNKRFLRLGSKPKLEKVFNKCLKCSVMTGNNESQCKNNKPPWKNNKSQWKNKSQCKKSSKKRRRKKALSWPTGAGISYSNLPTTQFNRRGSSPFLL